MEPVLRLPVILGRVRYRALVALLMAVLIAGACTGTGASYVPPPPPSESAARDLVNNAIDLAISHDFDRLCALGTPECRKVLDATGTDTVPTAAPKFVSVTTVPNRETSPGTWAPGGVLFLLCGLDGKNQAYHSQMLVFENHQGSGLVAEEPVFWGSLTIGSAVAEPPPSRDATTTWQGCPN